MKQLNKLETKELKYLRHRQEKFVLTFTEQRRKEFLEKKDGQK